MWQVTFYINASNFWTRHLIPLSHLDLRNMRRLFLHVSPLSDAEYNLYVADLMELSFTDRSAAMRQDEDYERVIIGVREVRKISVCDSCRRRYDYQIFLSDHPEDGYSVWGRILCRD